MTTPNPKSNPADEEDSSSTAFRHEARAGDRGKAAGRNVEQNRAIGQDDPIAEGSRMGRERDKTNGFPGTADIGTDAAQTEEARQNGNKHRNDG